MHSRGSLGNQSINGTAASKMEKDAGHHPPPSTNMMPPSAYQKRASIPSTLSYSAPAPKEALVAHPEPSKTAPPAETPTANAQANRETVISPAPSVAASSSSQPSNRGSPASTSSGPAQKTSMAFPPTVSKSFREEQLEYSTWYFADHLVDRFLSVDTVAFATARATIKTTNSRYRGFQWLLGFRSSDARRRLAKSSDCSREEWPAEVATRGPACGGTCHQW